MGWNSASGNPAIGSLERFGDAKAKVVASASIRRIHISSIRRSQGFLIAFKRIGSKPAHGAIAAFYRRAISWQEGDVGFVTIFYPLINIAVHIA